MGWFVVYGAMLRRQAGSPSPEEATLSITASDQVAQLRAALADTRKCTVRRRTGARQRQNRGAGYGISTQIGNK